MTFQPMFDPNTPHINNLLRARAEYLARQQGRRKPQGVTRHGVWRPTGNESRGCCKRFNTRLDLFAHCCSLEHVARLYGATVEELERTLALMEGENR